MDFTTISKTYVLFENLSFVQTPGKFFSFTLMPLVRAKLPGKKWGDAIGSLGEPAAVLAGIRRLRRGFWPGRMWRRYRGSPWLGLRTVLGQGGRWWGRAAAQPGGGRQKLALRRKGRRGLNCSVSGESDVLGKVLKWLEGFGGGHRSTSRGSGLGAPAAEPGAGRGALE
jgi:hypothetical protein